MTAHRSTRKPHRNEPTLADILRAQEQQKRIWKAQRRIWLDVRNEAVRAGLIRSI